MYYLPIIYNPSETFSEGCDSFSKDLGVYAFKEIPRIGETIIIEGSGSYVIKNIEHTFVKKSKPMQPEVVDLTRIYVN